MPQLPTNNPVRNHWHIPCGVSLPVIQRKQEIWMLIGSACLPLHVPLPCTYARPLEAHLALPLIHKSGSQDSKRSHFHPGGQTSSGLHFPTPLGLAFWMFELTCFHHTFLPSFLLPSSLPPILPPSLFLLSSIPQYSESVHGIIPPILFIAWVEIVCDSHMLTAYVYFPLSDLDWASPVAHW